MKKRVLILRDSETKVTVEEEYIQISTIANSYIVSFAHLGALYLNKAIDLPIGACYAISQKVPFFVIDEHGYILAELRESDETV